MRPARPAAPGFPAAHWEALKRFPRFRDDGGRCAVHRRYRERQLTRKQARHLTAAFRPHVEAGTWTLVPLSESLLWEVHEALRALRSGVFIRAGDAIHLG